jgi:protein SCO1
MEGRYNILFFLMAVLLLPATVYGVVKWYENAFQKLPAFGKSGHTIEDFNLQSQQGKTVCIEQWKNKIVVADFFFTHCPSICPKMTNNLKKVQQSFAADSNIAIYSFTVDPERDSVQRLAVYAAQFDIKNNWQLLTGNKMEIYRLARKSFEIVATDGDGGPEDFIHSDKLVLVDGRQQIRGYYKGTEDKEITQLIHDIKKLKNEN